MVQPTPSLTWTTSRSTPWTPKVRGTPTYFVIQPDGIIAWTSDNTARYADAGEAVAALAVVDA